MLFGNVAESKQEPPNYQMKVWIPVVKQNENQPFIFERLVFYALWYNEATTVAERISTLSYKFLLFDLDHTLLDFDTAEDIALTHFLEEQGVTEIQTYKDYYIPMNKGLWRELEQGKITKPELVNTRFSRLFAHFGIEKDGKCAICLPGPPREMKWLFENCVVDYLKRFSSKQMYYRVIRTIGIGESDLETKLLPIIDNQKDPTIATYAKEGECTLRVASQRETMTEAQLAVENMIREIDKLIGKYIYSYNDEELAEVVVRKLRENKLSLSSAESCTGGMFASCITDVPGASNVFSHGFVTYSETAKAGVLGVDSKIIEECSVVSSEVAVLMSKGAQKSSNSDIAISITGYAGPEADEGRENGNAFIGYACGNKLGNKSGFIEINTKRNDRKWNRNFFKLRMLLVVYNIINDAI